MTKTFKEQKAPATLRAKPPSRAAPSRDAAPPSLCLPMSRPSREFLSGNGSGDHLKRLRVNPKERAPLPPPTGLLSRLHAFLPQMASANEQLKDVPAGESIVELVEKDDDLDESSLSEEAKDHEQDRHRGKVEMNLAIVEASSSSDEDHDPGAIPAAAVARDKKNAPGVVHEL